VGLLPELANDLENVSVPQHYLNHINDSAERFVLIWEWEWAESISQRNQIKKYRARISCLYFLGGDKDKKYAPCSLSNF